MPIGEVEKHPFLNQGKIKDANKMILGSFPVYECTDPENCCKQEKRKYEGSVKFFYGSNRSSLWTKYSEFIDNSITKPWNPECIIKSLETNKIAITDLIVSCERFKIDKNKRTGEQIINQFSSEDSALHNEVLNYETIIELINNGVTKILCTSKGVLDKLDKKIIRKSKEKIASEIRTETIHLQEKFIKEIGGDSKSIINPVCRVYETKNKERLEVISIPSPGSPQRRIKDFGYNGDKKIEYANTYFEKAFDWFKA